VEPERTARHSARTAARKQAVFAEGNAIVCASASDEREGHGSIARRARGGWTGPTAAVPAPVAVDDMALTPGWVLTADEVLTADGVLTAGGGLVEAERGEPPQPLRHAHPITAMTGVQRMCLDRLGGHRLVLGITDATLSRAAMSSSPWFRSA
jgi:hypothetical protein